jgi:uncharacterized protein (UPF0332 family)
MESRRAREGKVATWEELSQDSLRAAKLLAKEGHFRSSISRAYYAAYCAIAGELATRGTSFPYGWNNPSHEQLPDLVAHNLPLPRGVRHQMNRNIRRLRNAREDADYRPGAPSGWAIAIECLQLSAWITRTLEIDDD